MDELERLLGARRWEPICLRTSIAQPEHILVKNGFRRARVDSNTLRPNESQLLRATQAVAPGWYPDVRVVLNRNVTCKRHTDGANRGHSYILFLGDFEGGALVFEDGSRIEAKRQWHRFDGQRPHWNEPHTGTKYSVVLYRSKVKSKSSLIHSRLAKKRS